MVFGSGLEMLMDVVVDDAVVVVVGSVSASASVSRGDASDWIIDVDSDVDEKVFESSILYFVLFRDFLGVSRRILETGIMISISAFDIDQLSPTNGPCYYI